MPPDKVLETLPSIDGIENEVKIDSPLGGGEDRAVLTTLILRIFQVMGPAMFSDPAFAKFARKLIEISGFPRTRQLGLFPEETLSPGDEHIMMAQGTKVDVNPVDDHAKHLAQHITFFQLLKNGQLDDQFNEQELDNLRLLIKIHAEEHNIMVSIIQAQQQASTSAGQDQAGNSAQQQGGLASLEQDTSPAGSQELRGRITQTAANVPGNNLQ